jgi:hypothetical protein
LEEGVQVRGKVSHCIVGGEVWKGFICTWRMAKDIERLCSWISLTDGENKGISISEGDT